MKRKANETINKLMIIRGVENKDIAEWMGISAPTLSRILFRPALMNAYQRAWLAKILRVNLSDIDAICNGERLRINNFDNKLVLEKI